MRDRPTFQWVYTIWGLLYNVPSQSNILVSPATELRRCPNYDHKLFIEKVKRIKSYLIINMRSRQDCWHWRICDDCENTSAPLTIKKAQDLSWFVWEIVVILRLFAWKNVTEVYLFCRKSIILSVDKLKKVLKMKILSDVICAELSGWGRTSLKSKLWICDRSIVESVKAFYAKSRMILYATRSASMVPSASAFSLTHFCL